MPAYLQLFLLCCTIGEIEIDQRLVWDAGKFSLCFEIVYSIGININSNLFL